MFRHLAITAAAATVFTAMPAHSQGAFNLGTLTGTLSQDAVTQSEERRAGRQRGSRGSKGAYRARLKGLCAQRAQYLAEEGNTPDYREVNRACRAEGF